MINKIIHISVDAIFVNTAFKIYEGAFYGKNEFLIIVPNSNYQPKYVDRSIRSQFIYKDMNLVNQVTRLLDDADVIVFHGITYEQALMAKKLKHLGKKLVWSVFGEEVYNNNLIIKNGSIGIKTRGVLNGGVSEWLREKLRNLYYIITKGTKEPKKVVKDTIALMDVVAILYEEELENYTKLGIVKADIQFLKFTYYPLNEVIQENSPFIKGNNVLLGNSATATNNHLEAFEIIQHINLLSRKLVCPLSYGDKTYSDKIVEEGSIRFGMNFQPLVDFLPLAEYQQIMGNCGIVIMNHYRQQAVGNVLNSIYLGAKVYLSQENTLYHYLKRLGCHIYCIEKDLSPQNESVLDLLSIDQMQHNRGILSKELNLESVISELRKKLSSAVN